MILLALPKVFADFQGAFRGKPLEAEVWNSSSNILRKNKKRGVNRVFCVRYQLGLSAPNPDTRNFSRKVSWNFKSFAKIK